MRLVLFGTPNFAKEIFSYLVEKKLSIEAIVTKPDQEQKGRDPLSPPVKKWAEAINFPKEKFFQPQKASAPSFLADLQKCEADLFVVVAYGQILKKELLIIPPLGIINVHTSLLPKYRGAAPIQRAIMAGEMQTGVTIMQMVEKLDAGDILAQRKIAIGSEMTFGELEQEMVQIAKPLLFETIQAIERKSVSPIPQEERVVNYAHKIDPSECEIIFDREVKNVHNLIRALSPSPGGYFWVVINGEKKRIKILRSKIYSTNQDLSDQDLSGKVGARIYQEKNRLIIACKKGAIELLQVQLQGKKEMSSVNFLQGVQGKIDFC